MAQQHLTGRNNAELNWNQWQCSLGVYPGLRGHLILKYETSSSAQLIFFHSLGIASTFLPVLQLFPYKDHCFDPKCFELPFTSSPSCPILPFPILSLLSTIWVIQQYAEVIHLSDMFTAEWEPARKQDQRKKSVNHNGYSHFHTRSLRACGPTPQTKYGRFLVLHMTASDFKSFYFQSLLCHHRWRYPFSWGFFFSCIQITECENSQMPPQRQSCISWRTVQRSPFT